ncbi:MAG: type IV toxin-antitoxin system AbiEi family antitoxin domain-containing protein [Solirubrobacterales bacterium]
MAQLAARQHGVVSFAQLAAAEVGRRGVARRVEAGHLYRVHRGVYAVGHPKLGDEGRWMAAVLAYGGGAVLSHRAAAGLWGLLVPIGGAVDVTVAGDAGRAKRAGIRLHRSQTLRPQLTTHRRNIPVTTPARTIADLRRVVPPDELRKAVREASVLGLDLGPGLDSDLTRSELESHFLRLCRRHRLVAPEVNAALGRFRVDFLWREQGLIVETDGYRYHRGRAAFEDDRQRDLELRLGGYTVVRFTDRQLRRDPAAVAGALRRLLRAG